MPRQTYSIALGLATLACGAAQAQQPVQVVKPPQAQVWIDVATFGGFGMPAGGGNPMAMIGSLFGRGGGSGGNTFGQTQTGGNGRWVDVTLYTRNNPQLTEAQQAVPAGFLSPALKLQSPKQSKDTAPEPGEERVIEPEHERPKGKMLLFWGCGDTVRAGQPRVVDFATASPADLAKFFQSRRATQRGTHSAVGRPAWPSADDARMVPAQASLVGEHQVTGSGVPEGLRFQIPAGQDLMPAIALKQTAQPAGSTLLEWQALPTARAYFVSAMGAREGAADSGEMVMWSSSEQPDMGFGLIDYQTNPAVDRWLKEQVLLVPQTTRCAIPKGVFSGQGAMVRMIAYGNELNLAQPPRPTDPRVAWEPVWAAKIRVKSQTTAILGMEGGMGMMGGAEAPGPAPAASEPEAKKPGVKDLLRGLLGR